MKQQGSGKYWDAVDLGNCPKSESSRKWLGEGAKGLLDPASKRPLALVQNRVAPVQKRVWVVQTTLGRHLLPGPKRSRKDLLHPLPTTFGDFPFLGNFPGPQRPKASNDFRSNGSHIFEVHTVPKDLSRSSNARTLVFSHLEV